MNGAIIAFDPCNVCENHDMCSMCELTLRRDGALRTDKWISVEERLPEESGKYLVYRKNYLYYHSVIINYDGCAWYYLDDEWGRCELYDITHWMPLPEAPKMRKEDEGK